MKLTSVLLVVMAVTMSVSGAQLKDDRLIISVGINRIDAHKS